MLWFLTNPVSPRYRLLPGCPVSLQLMLTAGGFRRAEAWKYPIIFRACRVPSRFPPLISWPALPAVLSLLEDAANYEISDVAKCRYVSKTVLNAASPEYNEAGNWLGLLYAVQALGSVAWAVVLPRFKSRKFSYTLSLLLGAAGFIMTGLITSQYLLFVAFILIGCAWAAMLAWPFTILTNSLRGGNIGAYLRTFQLHDMRAADCRRSCRRMDSVDAPARPVSWRPST